MISFMRPALPSVAAVLVLSTAGSAFAAPTVTAVLEQSSCAPPAYPAVSLRAKHQGKVKLALRLDAGGKVLESRLLQSSMYSRLDQAAKASLAACRFTASAGAGRAAVGWVTYEHVWQLKEPAKPVWKPGSLVGPPEALLDFFLKARAADSLVDALARCLAMPDYPGSKWRADVTRALCEMTWTAPISLALVEQHLRDNKLAELDARYQKDLDRHFSDTAFSEVIHLDIELFDDSPAAARVSEAWLKKAPDSPFAQAARGMHLFHLASLARGSAPAADTSEKQWRESRALERQSVALLHKATVSVPRLLPALYVMLQIGIGGDNELVDYAIKQASAADPDCYRIAQVRLKGLMPRWGGSHAAMREFAATLVPRATRRPLLATLMHRVEEDQAMSLHWDEQYANAVSLLQPAALAAPSPQVLASLAAAMQPLEDQFWESLAALLAAQRFAEVTPENAYERGRLLYDAEDYAWAAPALEYAAARHPEPHNSRYVLGMNLRAMGELERALPHLHAVAADGIDPAHSKYAHYLALKTNMELGDWPGALGVALAYTKKYASDPYGWRELGFVNDMLGRRADADRAFARFRKFGSKDKLRLLQSDIFNLDVYLKGARDTWPP